VRDEAELRRMAHAAEFRRIMAPLPGKYLKIFIYNRQDVFWSQNDSRRLSVIRILQKIIMFIFSLPLVFSKLSIRYPRHALGI